MLIASCSNESDALSRAAAFLVEPDQAQFSNVSRSGNTICGLIKGKTRIDSYEGYRPFWSDPAAGGTSILSFDTADQFLIIATNNCSSQFGELLQVQFSKTKVQIINDEISKNAPNN